MALGPGYLLAVSLGQECLWGWACGCTPWTWRWAAARQAVPSLLWDGFDLRMGSLTGWLTPRDTHPNHHSLLS